MKKVFRVCYIKEMEVCIPSTDYYSYKEDWQTETVNVLTFADEFDSEEEAIKSLEHTGKGVEYTILPFYKIK